MLASFFTRLVWAVVDVVIQHVAMSIVNCLWNWCCNIWDWLWQKPEEQKGRFA